MVLTHQMPSFEYQRLKMRSSCQPRQHGLVRRHRASAIASLDCCAVPDDEHEDPAEQMLECSLDTDIHRSSSFHLNRGLVSSLEYQGTFFPTVKLVAIQMLCSRIRLSTFFAFIFFFCIRLRFPPSFRWSKRLLLMIIHCCLHSLSHLQGQPCLVCHCGGGPLVCSISILELYRSYEESKGEPIQPIPRRESKKTFTKLSRDI